MSFYPIAGYISSASIIIVFLLGCVLFRYLRAAHRFLILLFFLFLTVDIYTLLSSGNNLWVSHVLTLTEVVFLGLALWRLAPGALPRRRVQWGIVGFAIVWVVAKLSGLETFDVYDNVTRPIASVLLIAAALSVMTFENQFKRIVAPKNDTNFWVLIAILTQYAATLFFNVSYNLLTSLPSEFLLASYYFQWGGTVIANICIIVSMLLQKRNSARVQIRPASPNPVDSPEEEIPTGALSSAL